MGVVQQKNEPSEEKQINSSRNNNDAQLRLLLSTSAIENVAGDGIKTINTMVEKEWLPEKVSQYVMTELGIEKKGNYLYTQAQVTELRDKVMIAKAERLLESLKAEFAGMKISSKSKDEVQNGVLLWCANREMPKFGLHSVQIYDSLFSSNVLQDRKVSNDDRLRVVREAADELDALATPGSSERRAAIEQFSKRLGRSGLGFEVSPARAEQLLDAVLTKYQDKKELLGALREALEKASANAQ